MRERDDIPLVLQEGRFARFETIEWWDQSLLTNGRVLVVGAGALGNEVIKNLALLGVGHIIVVDMDRVECSNLSRSVLFRPGDEGKSKVECIQRGVHDIYPRVEVMPIEGNVLADVGLGLFRWAQVVVGALDNREARVFVNQACARVGRPWVDGGIEVLNGIARVFAPPETACYECTMGQVDWDLLNKRRSCTLLARRAAENEGVSTTPTTASVVGAIQAQEVVKFLHGMETLAGKGFVFDGRTHDSYVVQYPVKPDCPWHEPACPIEAVDAFDASTTLEEIWMWAAGRLGGLDALDLSRELVDALECGPCGVRANVFDAAEHLREKQVRCPVCGHERSPSFYHSIHEGNGLLKMTAGEIGLPHRDIIWARHGEDMLGIELGSASPPGAERVKASCEASSGG